jgi:hypothetical protein
MFLIFLFCSLSSNASSLGLRFIGITQSCIYIHKMEVVLQLLCIEIISCSAWGTAKTQCWVCILFFGLLVQSHWFSFCWNLRFSVGGNLAKLKLDCIKSSEWKWKDFLHTKRSVRIRHHLSIKEGRLFVLYVLFIMLRSTNPHLTQLHSWYLWKALNPKP